MQNKHIIAIALGMIIGIPILLGATGWITALMLPAFLKQEDEAKGENNRRPCTDIEPQIVTKWRMQRRLIWQVLPNHFFLLWSSSFSVARQTWKINPRKPR